PRHRAELPPFRIGRTGEGDDRLAQLVLRHEDQHGETMIQAMGLAGLPWAAGRPSREPGPATGTGLEAVAVPGGPCTLGAPAAGFPYDNERPRHRAGLPPFRIARTPITNATFLTFVEGGGYVRREWWSDEGWAWKEEYDITHPGGSTALGERPPDAPVMHVSWFEADAFARAHGARLPTEAEWEKAATWDQETRTAVAPPSGNLDLTALAPQPPRRETASPCGVLGLLGDVWEWTASAFAGYDGFRADPYRKYSEVFFGDRHRVLRGGSWATRSRIATPTFRNWDLPHRRQLFAGFRLAWDA
ncbi:MAG: SUMF1/EgtB/PvdO family nonheme iron enzyme, partial [Actinomycetota bacterium]|nr:SUMF1/EgtB/PvdO family nonheme iron enzyme [Actinomycetota bacterium]